MFRSILSIPLLALFIFCLSHLGCGPSLREVKGHVEEKVVAKVNDEPITLRRFHDFMKQQNVVTTNDSEKDLKKKEEKLNELIREILIDQKALSYDWESDSDFVKRKKKHMNDFLISYLHNKEIVEKTQVTDEEIKDYYEQHKDEYYATPEKRQIRRLLIKIEADSTQKDYEKILKKAEKEAKKKIDALYQRAKAGEDFVELVRQYSEDVGRRDLSGNMGYLERGELSPAVDSVVFSLEVGEISPPVKDERGYHLISVLDIKPKEYREFSERVAGGIRRFLEEERIKEKTSEYLEQLKEKTKYVYHEEILDQPDSLVDPDDWVLIINDQDTIKFEYYSLTVGGFAAGIGKDSLTLEERKGFLRDYLGLPAILVKDAEEKGYRDSIEYEVEERAFILEETRKKIEEKKIKRDFTSPSMKELEAYYQAHKIDYPPLGVPVHVLHIIFDDSLEAVKVLNQIREGADFVELAKKYYPGEPEIRDIAYDLGFITQGEMPQSFYEKALSLKVGEVSEPVRTEWGFHLIKLVEKKEEGKTFADILPEIEKDLKLAKRREHLENWEKSLYDDAEIWIDQDLLEEFQLDKPEG